MVGLRLMFSSKARNALGFCFQIWRQSITSSGGPYGHVEGPLPKWREIYLGLFFLTVFSGKETCLAFVILLGKKWSEKVRFFAGEGLDLRNII